MAAGALAVFAGGAVASSQLSTVDTNTINACKGPNGSLRVVDSGASCKNNEKPLSWNVVGPPGPAGTNGVNGLDGKDGQSVAVSVEPAGANCPSGGEKIVAASGVSYVCNGQDGAPGPAGQDGHDGQAGATGQAGQSVAVSVEPAGANCSNGGVKLVGSSGTSYVCNGRDGQDGAPGSTSLSGLAGQSCSFGDVNGTYSVALGNDDTVVIRCVPSGGEGGGTTTTTGPPPDGTPCDDGNASTVNDVYTNGVCAGTAVAPETCDGIDNDHDGIVDDHLVDAPPLPNATPACFSGQWRIASCNPGYADADGIVANGCEVNLNTDPQNCGGVGILPPPDAISHATYGCVNGHFVILACDQGYQDLDNNPADGCEFQSAALPTRAGSASGSA